MRTTLTRPPGLHRDVVLRPPAVAMAFVGEGLPHEVVAVPGVALGEHEVLVAVELSTVCGSDVHTAQGRRAASVPLVLGHESVGRIVAVGDGGVQGSDGSELAVGDRVVWSVTASCGTCDRCAAGIPQKCRSLVKYGHERIAPHAELNGGFASHVQLRPGTTIVRVPEQLPATVAAPASCATATAWAAVARAGGIRPLEGARVRVHGAGLVGISAAAIAAEHGAVVDVRDPDAARAAQAEEFGATGFDGAPDVVIEASGHAVRAALDEVEVGGVVVLVGSVFPTPPVPLDAESIVRRLVTVTGVHNYTGAELTGAVGFLSGAGRAYPFAGAVGAVHPLTELDGAIRAAAAPGAPLRIGVAVR
ncbi:MULTISPECIES: alcohol dehydrogenase catalytic domain-containing protein [unclassified Microbacterium]|uniref:alcohol dehydrogenase catalytic domain-containing protein n=1 Tax=unclassified Microbacterium TaxID=2609290 RepID=UPI0012FC69DD|nr:alcohol dehydrogenase catalytic domain-containing protein [Microbacterium sp. MAH-37]MVQ40706.1 alcohol dehydrogenase catalytic domain-containing protein [Microbacterium sp. MAH-37]